MKVFTRTGAVLGSLALATGVQAGPNSLNSGAIPTQLSNVYSGLTSSCSNCHGNNSSTRPDDSDGLGTSYGRALDRALVLLPRNSTAQSPFNAVTTPGQIVRAIQSIESTYAPYISAVAGQSFSGATLSTRSVTVPGTTTSIAVSVSPGLGFTGAAQSLTALNPLTSDLQNLAPSFVTTSFNLATTEARVPLQQRGTRRRAGQPYSFDINPINGQGFFNTTSVTQARGQVRITFANIAPTGRDDLGFVATSANTATNRLALDVLANDTDADSDGTAMTVELIAAPPAADGVIERNATSDGFLYTLPPTLPAQSKTVSFTYRPVDNDSATTSEAGNVTTVNIRIPAAPRANPPVALDDAFALREDRAFSGSVATNDSDPDGIATVGFSVKTAPPAALGSVSMAANGAFTFTPAPDVSGTASFVYTAFDGTFSDEATVTLTISPVNDAPTAQADAAVATAANTATSKLTLNVLANDVDVDSTDLSVVLVSGFSGGAADGVLELNPTSTGFLYTLPATLPTRSRTVSFLYRARDDLGETSGPVRVRISIPAATAVGGPPIARNDRLTGPEDITLTGDVKADNGNGPDADPDGIATLSFSLTSPPAAGTGALTFNTDGTFSFAPTANFNGWVSFDYTAVDNSQSDSATVRLNFTPVNDAPVALAETVIATAANTATNRLDVDVLANDSDVEPGALSVELISGLAGGAGDGVLELNPARDGFLYSVPSPLPARSRTVSFRYRPVDDDGATGNTVTTRITVPAASNTNSAPIARNDAFTFDEDTILSGDLGADNGNGADSDADAGDTLRYTVRSAPPSGQGRLVLRRNGQFTFMPAENVNGTVTFTYTLFDGTDTDTGSVTLTIAPVNDPPVATVIALSPRTESEVSFVQDLLSSAFVQDPDGDRLTVTNLRFTKTHPANLTITDADVFTQRNTRLTIRPRAFGEKGSGPLVGLDNGENAQLTFTYDVSDGIAPAVSNSLTLTVIGLDNGLGRLAGAYADSISRRYNNHFGGTAEANGSCHTCHRPGQVDADVDTVDECRQNPPVFNEYGLQLCLNRNASQGPLTDLVRRMADAESDFAPQLNPVARITIDETTQPGAAVGAPMTARSTGKTVDGAAAQIVEYLIVNAGQPAQTDASGQFTVSPQGQLQIAPSAQVQPGLYSFVVLPVNDAGQKDNNGALIPGRPGFFPNVASLQTTVTVEVSAVLVQTQDDSAVTEEDTAVQIDVLANDTGSVGREVSIAAAPGNGTATVNTDMTVAYTPDAGFVGQDSFTYRVTNARGTTSPARVSVTVQASGTVLARADSIATLQDTAITIRVLQNDGNVAQSGANATIVTIETAPPAVSGVLRVVGQTLEFTPAQGFSGQVSAQYRARNPNIQGSAGSVGIISISVITGGGTLISDAQSDPELRRVALAFEQTCAGFAGGNADFLAACANLTAAAANGEDLSEAMRALRNEETLAAVDMSSTIARGLGRGIKTRMRRIRDGAARGFDVSGVDVSINDQSLPSQLLSSLLDGALGIRAEDAQPDTDWGFFISGDLSLSDKDASGNAQGFDLKVGSVTIGADMATGDGNSIGLALGYSEAETSFANGGALDAQGAQLTLYGTRRGVFGPGIDFEGYLSVGQLRFRSDRRIRFTANGVVVDALAQSRFDGRYVNIAPALVYRQGLSRYGDPLGAPRTGTEVTWKLGLDYLRTDLDAYTETGGAGLGLSTQAQSYDSLQIFASAELSRPVYLSPRYRSEVYGGLTVRAELLDDTRTLTSSFAAGGAGAPTFTVSEPGSKGFGFALNLGTRLAFHIGEFNMDYTYDANSDDLRTHNVSLGFSRDFGRRGGRIEAGVSRGFTSAGAPDLNAAISYKLDF